MGKIKKCSTTLVVGLDVHPYVSAPAVTGPKVQRHDGAVVGQARSAARGLACSSAAHGPARGAAHVSPKKPSCARPVVRPGWPVNATKTTSMVLVHRHVTTRGCGEDLYVKIPRPSLGGILQHHLARP